jgi:acyl carrier protein
MASVLDRVKKVTAEVLKVDESKITQESRFVQDLGAESVQSLELVAAFEVEFEIELEQEASLEIKTVGDAARFIEEQL